MTFENQARLDFLRHRSSFLWYGGERCKENQLLRLQAIYFWALCFISPGAAAVITTATARTPGSSGGSARILSPRVIFTGGSVMRNWKPSGGTGFNISILPRPHRIWGPRKEPGPILFRSTDPAGLLGDHTAGTGSGQSRIRAQQRMGLSRKILISFKGEEV